MPMSEKEREVARQNAVRMHARGQVAHLLSNAATVALADQAITHALQNAMGACCEAVRTDQATADEIAKILRDTADEIDHHWGEG